jgi:hypothetical protein
MSGPIDWVRYISNPNHPVSLLQKRRRSPSFIASGVQVKIRFVCASAAAAFGFACSSSAFSRVVVAYAPAAVVVAAPRPVYYYGPPARPAYYYMSPPPVYTVPVVLPVPVAVAVPAPVPKPLPMYTTVVVPASTNYGWVSAANVMYAQPVVVVPR